MSKNRIRIKDIAQCAGVSTGTVDRVIHERGSVSSKARETVQRVMTELNYSPNIMARTLANNKVYRIGVVIPESKHEPYWQLQMRGMQSALETMEHYGVSLEYSLYKLNSPNSFSQKGHKALKSRVDALIIAPIFSEQGMSLLDECAQAGIPCVLINTNLQHSHKACYIGQDSYQSGVVAAKLLDHLMNPEDIAILLHLETGVPSAEHLIQKQNGFQDYFVEHPRKVITRDLSQFQTTRKLRTELASIFQDYPRIGGLFVTSSRIHLVMEVLPKLHHHGLKSVGFDLIAPNLLCLETGRVNFLINQNPQIQGYLAARQLIHYLVLGKAMSKQMYIPFDIVIKENMVYYHGTEIAVSVV